ncbi:MAG: hypothetical protein ACFFBD_02365 [Candidatus Hodarchaeota archaeon]
MNDANKIILNKYEKEFIDSFGEMYDLHGRSETMGLIFAVLTLKARAPEAGMDQQEIASIIGKSVSTVSRTLNRMVEAKFCTFIEEMNEKYRRERKYFVKTSFRELALDRIKQQIKQILRFKDRLEQIKRNVLENAADENAVNENKDLLDELDALIIIYSQLVEYYEASLGTWIKTLQF